MHKQYWIVWGYNDNCGHTSGADSYNSFDKRNEVLLDSNLWHTGCYPSSTFETINGEVI